MCNKALQLRGKGPMASKEIGMRIEGERNGVGLDLLLGHRAFGVTPLKKVWGKDMWAEIEWLE